MRVRRIYVQLKRDERARTEIEATPGDFSESLRYDGFRFANQEEFLHRCCQQVWIQEVHEVLRQWISPADATLSIEPGLGEHEVFLFHHGYDVTASDFVAGSCDEAMRLFPGFRSVCLDILTPPSESRYDVVLMLGGMDQYFDDADLVRAFQKTKILLRQKGRLIFSIRHHDNICTRLIDHALWPLVVTIQNIKYALQGWSERWRRRIHGYARSGREVMRIAEQAGYGMGRVGDAGFGVEWTRLGLTCTCPVCMPGFTRSTEAGIAATT